MLDLENVIIRLVDAVRNGIILYRQIIFRDKDRKRRAMRGQCVKIRRKRKLAKRTLRNKIALLKPAFYNLNILAWSIGLESYDPFLTVKK